METHDIRLAHRVIGSKHVFTSPDVPELHVSHEDRAVALSNVQPALDVLRQIKGRIAARQVLRDRRRERVVT